MSIQSTLSSLRVAALTRNGTLLNVFLNFILFIRLEVREC